MARQMPPPTKTLTAAEMREQLDGVVERVRRDEAGVLVEQEGRPAVAIVSAEELARLDRAAEDREAWRILRAMREPFKDVPPEEVERETNRILAEIREENRARRRQTPNP